MAKAVMRDDVGYGRSAAAAVGKEKSGEVRWSVVRKSKNKAMQIVCGKGEGWGGKGLDKYKSSPLR